MPLITHAEEWNRLLQKREQVSQALLERVHRLQVFGRATHLFGNVRGIGRMIVSPPERLVTNCLHDQTFEDIDVFALLAKEPGFDRPCSIATDLWHLAEIRKAFQTLCGLFKT